VAATDNRGISRWVREPFCGLSHALGAVLSLAGMIVLLAVTWGSPWRTAAVAVYGTSLVMLYTASALAHSVHCSPKAEWRYEQFDYMAIFVLIAGTYTPVCLGPLWDVGAWGVTLLAVEWGLAAVGIASVLFMRSGAGWVRVAAYAVMAWLVLIAIGPLSRAVPPAALAWLLAGGVCYTVGAMIFATHRPRLWPGRFGYHELWHCLVLAGSACHFVMIARYAV
jgi:hemolysin III